MTISKKQLESVFALPAGQRYSHFVKQVVDQEEAWGLFSDGWAVATTDSACTIFPLWPDEDYAEACATDQWVGYRPQAIPLDDLVENLLPELQQEGNLVAIHPTPQGAGAMPSIDRLLKDIEDEIEAWY